MNTKQSVALASVSALAAGAAQGAVVYSGELNRQQGYFEGEARQGIDLNGDSIPEFTFGFEVAQQKPYLDARTYVSSVIPLQSGTVDLLAKPNKGLPVTPAGTMIDLSYATTYPASSDDRAYFYHDDNDALAGDWSGTAINEGYAGIRLSLGGNTHYGWLHFIDNPSVNPATLTLVDWAYEDTPNTGIETAIVPEPSSLALAGAGMAALLMFRRRE